MAAYSDKQVQMLANSDISIHDQNKGIQLSVEALKGSYKSFLQQAEAKGSESGIDKWSKRIKAIDLAISQAKKGVAVKAPNAELAKLAVGAIKTTPLNIRVISASHRNLKELVNKGQFRQDLYYRLNGIVLSIPALRNRQDKTWIIQQISAMVSNDFQLKFTKEAETSLKNYSWPGNIREMINVLELCVALNDGNVVELADLPDHVKYIIAAPK